MKKKTLIPLIAISVVAIVMLVVYFALLSKKNEGPNASGDQDFFTVLTIDVSGLDRVVLNNESMKAEFVRADGMWSRKDADYFPVKQSILSLIERVLLSNLNAFAKLSDVSDLSEYGLDTPMAEMYAYSGEELLCSVILGDKVPTKDQYYCMFSGSDEVYTVSANYQKYMCMESNEFLENMELPTIEDKSYLRDIHITGEAFDEFHAVYDTKSPFDYSGVSLFTWTIYEPLNGSFHADTMDNAWLDQLDSYCKLVYDKLVAYRPTDLSKYGLDNPCATLKVDYTDASGRQELQYVLTLGNQLETGEYYARIEGVEWIFTMSKEAVDIKFDTDVFDWSYNTVVYPATGCFEQIVVVAGGNEYILKNEGGEDPNNPDYSVNGIKVSAATMQAWRSQVLTLKTSSVLSAELAEGEEPILSLEFQVNKEELEDRTIAFYPHENGMYRVAINGLVDFTIDGRDVDAFVAYMNDTF